MIVVEKKRILLTNFGITNFSGSEIDTVTIANYFFKLGYEVDIFTLEFGNPLLSIVLNKIRVIDVDNSDKLYKKYDLIWAHHYPLLDYIIFTKKIKAEHIIYISLSSYEPLEMLPNYYHNLSIIGALSKEAKNVLKKQMKKDKEILLFPNYATKEYFDEKIEKVEVIKNICIVSNHIPKELMEFYEIANLEKINVDIYGIGHIVEYINSDILKKYDLIISIGKTVNYGLAMGKLVYCYDRFGGYGFITSKNIEQAYSNNFSGRGFGVKLSGKQIYKDILNNYKSANKDIEYNRKFALNVFSLEKNISNILEKLNEKNIVKTSELIKEFPDLVIKSRLYVENMNLKNKMIKYQEKVICDNNENLNNLKKDNEKLLKLIDKIYSSTCWRITYPIRFVKKVIYKILNK